MDLNRSHPLRAAALALALGLACVTALAAAPAARAQGAPLLPNLVTLHIGQNDLAMFKQDGKPMLAFSNEVGNKGQGPLEIFAAPESGDCNGDGRPKNDRDAYQRIFSDDGDGVFDRSLDTASTEQRIGCEVRNSAFYWQIYNLARYKLVVEKTGRAVVTSDKIAYCTVDSAFHFDPAGTLGISIGWADLYGAYTPGQEINVSKVDPGRYCLRSRADPRNLLVESNNRDNVREVPIHLDPATQTVERLAGSCQFRR
jgi:lysyl oxidase